MVFVPPWLCDDRYARKKRFSTAVSHPVKSASRPASAIHVLSARAALQYEMIVSSWNGRCCLLVCVRSHSPNSLIIICRISRGVCAIRKEGGAVEGEDDPENPTNGTGSPATRRGLFRAPEGLRAGVGMAPPSWGSYALFQAIKLGAKLRDAWPQPGGGGCQKRSFRW